MKNLTSFFAYGIYSALFLLPIGTFAQTASGATDIKTLFSTILDLVNNVLVPLLFSIAFIVFLYNVYKYFIAGGAEAESRAEGGRFVLYSIIGFALMFSIWGLVNVLVNTFGFGSASQPNLPTINSTGGGSAASGGTSFPGATPTQPPLTTPI